MKGLELSRKRDELIYITNEETGERIELKVIEIGRNEMRLGIDAPKNYRILREELPKYDNSKGAK